MNLIRRIAIAYAIILGIVTALNYIPGLTDAQGRVFGIFALDIYDDMLHFASAAWAAIAASLSLEYGAKSIYARAIGALAGIAPAQLKIRSVVRGLNETDLAGDSRIRLIETRSDGTSIIETARYRELTEILGALVARGRNLVEIAGNDDVFVTVLMPAGIEAKVGERLITVPLQSRAGWRRDGLTIKVAELAGLMRGLGISGARFEHVYDY
jgi:hypothetical protein